MNPIFEFFLDAYQNTPSWQIALEAIAFVFGIASVWYAKQENILVYPTGIICTIITVYLLYINSYLGDMMMNLYYSGMSIYGWWNWSRKKDNKYMVPISRTNTKEKQIGVFCFVVTMLVTYGVYNAFDYTLEIPNYIDIITSGIFFTAMWYMANKKIENWTLWIIGDLITIPLYAYRGLGMLSLQYLIFTVLAIYGYLEWKKSLSNNLQTA
ncbi:nicotinamide riboside transporter PnuC [Winogradskyella aurantiaca]|uniref:nicotinamide riboside transporter PnuC n=1 Tax=Winogradskyella aurantiaca TaxID=2219558 RepID=UPI0018E532C6|nr:nicotinamide riboside transporter PnuC [Winogradskyella aurantiaca]